MLSIKIAGPAGFGIKVTGSILAKVFLRLGYSVFAYTEYPSLIRGGHNTFQVDVNGECHPEDSDITSEDEGSRKFSGVNSPSSKVDILIALTGEAIEKEKDNLKKDSLVICDDTLKHESIKTLKQKGTNIIDIPLIEFAKKNGGELMKNTVALGALFAIIDNVIPRSGATRNLVETLNKVLEDTFGHKGVVAEQNVKAAAEGYEWLKNNKDKIKSTRSLVIPTAAGTPRDDILLLISGNQACALGAVAAGCQLYSAYPMTPATEILHYLEAKQKETKMIVHQPEDEIAAIHAALGASFAGARSAVGTSGGGFALMTEGLSLAGQLELPLVIFEVMRPAPATGLPTWTEQGDLSFVLNAGHGDFARAILAPGNPAECFELTQKAFNLADQFQIPVFVMTDKLLGESYYTTDEKIFNNIEKVNRGKIIGNQKLEIGNQGLNELFARYKLEKDGVSPRTIPGTEGGEYVANSDEHDEFGISSESAEIRKEQMDKRLKKLAELQKEIPLPTLYGPKDAKTTLVCWGSMLGACLDTLKHESIKALKQNNINILHFSYIYPLPMGLTEFLKKFNNLVLVENNASGHFGKLLRQETGIEIKDKLLKYDGRPFWSDEIAKLL
ncbi:MAG: 2-oxoacid:acceptor oxidoreductase subunit alpha [Patescibacteria group bacterium]|nr:2-oxoacid:acceptor oxidoreductase subunit alpha [Patescibacteria group bacterium]